MWPCVIVPFFVDLACAWCEFSSKCTVRTSERPSCDQTLPVLRVVISHGLSTHGSRAKFLHLEEKVRTKGEAVLSHLARCTWFAPWCFSEQSVQKTFHFYQVPFCVSSAGKKLLFFEKLFFLECDFSLVFLSISQKRPMKSMKT